jgi:hypothetical protein
MCKSGNQNNPYNYAYYDNPSNTSQNDSFFKTNVNVNVNVTPNTNLLKTVETKKVIPQNKQPVKQTLDKTKSMTMKKK